MNEWREITDTEPLAYEPGFISDGDAIIMLAKRNLDNNWNSHGWSGEDWEFDVDPNTMKYWMPLPSMKNEIKYNPTYRSPIDITERFDEFLIHTTRHIEGMSIETELEVDRYFRGEILLEKLLGQKVHNLILQFEKYECDNGEYHYVPTPEKQEPEQKRESSKLERILRFFK